jgi:hypothetical protein
VQRTRTPTLLAVAVTVMAVTSAPAEAVKKTVTGAPAPGPAKYDRLTVWTYGSSKVRTVFVVVPGSGAGAGVAQPVARDLVRRVKGLQVWAVDRREQAFEDQSVFRTRTLPEMRDYYLGGHYTAPGEAPFVGDWGLAVQTADLRRVVKAAADGGRQVVLGGHSFGAAQTLAYAAWDFGGRPGFRDLAGIVLIDGGLLGTFARSATTQPYTVESARQAAEDAHENPFNDSLGFGLPGIAEILGQLAATYAVREPEGVSQLQQEPLVPNAIKPSFPVTNEAMLGYVFDPDYSPETFRDLQVNAGELADTGDPRPWVSGEQTPIERFASALGGVDPDMTEWYYPNRLIVDVLAANPMRRDPPSTQLGLRLFHTSRITTPLYAFETDFTKGRALAAARQLVKHSKITRRSLAKDHAMTHNDPMLAAPGENTLLESLVPFLRRIAAR